MTKKEINDLQDYIFNLIRNRENIGQEPTGDDLFAVLGHLEILKESPTPLPSCVDEAAEEWFNSVKYKSDLSCAPVNAFKAGAEWMMNNLWHSADGGDLPEIDREVVVFTQEKGLSPKVCISHRPNPKGWDGTSISTGKTEHFQPMLYGKGGWSLPDVRWWLDCKLPIKENEI